MCNVQGFKPTTSALVTRLTKQVTIFDYIHSASLIYYFLRVLFLIAASKVEVLISRVPSGQVPSLLTTKFKRLGLVL